MRKTERQTDRHRQSCRCREISRQRCERQKDRQTDIDKVLDVERYQDKDSKRQTDRDKVVDVERYRDRDSRRQTDRHR